MKRVLLSFIDFLISEASLLTQDRAAALDKHFTKRFSDGEYANVLIAEKEKIYLAKRFWCFLKSAQLILLSL